MKKIKTLEELRKFILYLEDKYSLLDFEIDGIKPWQLMRVQIDYDLGILAGIMEQPHSKINTKKDKFIKLLNLIKGSIFSNPFFVKKRVDIIVFPHARIKKVDNEYIDIYTHYFEQELLQRQISFIEIEQDYLGKHYKKNRRWRYYQDFIILMRKILYRFEKIDFIDLELIKQVELELENKIGKYDLLNRFMKAVKYYKVEYKLYYDLFKKLSPKQIYLVPRYGGLEVIIKVAKDLNIETLEFQHGNFSKYHFGYYFGEDKKELDYFPDKFLVWNKYWQNRINFPIKDENIIIRKFDYLGYRKSLYSNIKKKKNQAVVLSQGVLGDRIAKKILDNWDYFKQFNIKYKLHPGEYGRWKKYPNLLQLSNYNNIEIIEDIDLYELFSSSEYQIGVFSTALYEGIEFDCKTILLDLPGVEEMYKFIEIYKVKVI